jgi:hypothetical protein
VSARVYVFGSNEAGRHGRGSAKYALTRGAIYGVGRGLTETPRGLAYAIPTKDARLGVRPLSAIANDVAAFLEFARGRSDLEFEITKIGCGLAGFSETEIEPLFRGAPSNCHLPPGWTR